MPDAEIVAGLRRGDPAAFDAAYAAYRRRVFAFLVRLSGHRALAEDISQETFLRLATRAVELAPDTQLLSWLFTVARNAFISHTRTTRVQARTTERLSGEPNAEGPTPLSSQLDRERARMAELALQSLPLAVREAVLLVGVEALSPAAAALVLGVSPESLRQRLSRGRALLRLELERLERDAMPVGQQTKRSES